MRTIKNGDYFDVQVRVAEDVVEIYQGEKAIGVITKEASIELMEFLKEFVDESV